LRLGRRKVRTPEPTGIEEVSKSFYTSPMPEPKIQRSNCRFLVQESGDGKPVVIVQLYQDTIPIFQDITIGFDLLGGTQAQQAKKVAELLNEHVLDVFVTGTETGEG